MFRKFLTGHQRAADSQDPREAKRIKPIRRTALDFTSEFPDRAPVVSCSFTTASNGASSQPPSHERAIGAWDKETLQASIRRVLPSAQPGLFPNDIYRRLLDMPNGFVIEKESNLRSFRTAIHQALIKLLDLEAVSRQSATTEKGGQSHRYIILEIEASHPAHTAAQDLTELSHGVAEAQQATSIDHAARVSQIEDPKPHSAESGIPSPVPHVVRPENSTMNGGTIHQQISIPRSPRDLEAQLQMECSDHDPISKASTPRVTETSRSDKSMKDQEALSQALVHVSHATPDFSQQKLTPRDERTSRAAATQSTAVGSSQKVSLGTSTEANPGERATPAHLVNHIDSLARKRTTRENVDRVQTPRSMYTQGTAEPQGSREDSQSQRRISNNALEPYGRAKIQHLKEASSGKDSQPITQHVPNMQYGVNGVSPACSAKAHTRPAEEAPDVSNQASTPNEKKTPFMQSKDLQSATASEDAAPASRPSGSSSDKPQTYNPDEPRMAGTEVPTAGRDSSMQKPTPCSTGTLNTKVETVRPNTHRPAWVNPSPQGKVGPVAPARELHAVKEPSSQAPGWQAIDPTSKSNVISDQVAPNSLPARSSGDVDDPAIREDNRDESVPSSSSGTECHSNLWTPINGAATSSTSPSSPQVAVTPKSIGVLDAGAHAPSGKSMCASSCPVESSKRKTDTKNPDGPKGCTGAIGREVINLADDVEERVPNSGTNEDMGTVATLELGKKVGRVRRIKAYREKLRQDLDNLQTRRRSALTEARNSQVKIDADRTKYNDLQGKLAKLRGQVAEIERQAAATQKEAVECRDLMDRKRSECQACATSIRTLEAEFTEIGKELEKLLQALDIL